jgi:hypothetical protein
MKRIVVPLLAGVLMLTSLTVARFAWAMTSTGIFYGYYYDSIATYVDPYDMVTVNSYAQSWGFPRTITDALPDNQVLLQYYDGSTQLVTVDGVTDVPNHSFTIQEQGTDWVVYDYVYDNEYWAGFSVAYNTSEFTCSDWNWRRANLAQNSWYGGDVGTCTPGDITSDERDSALVVLNEYRWLAGVSPASLSTSDNTDAQACAVLMLANNVISHDPQQNWNCYDALSGGVDAARYYTNIAQGFSSYGAIDRYSIDVDAPNHRVGHRRWMFSSLLTDVGFGWANGFSCFYHGTSGTEQRQWVAWPPDGYIPLQAMQTGGSNTIANAGWSVQSETLDFANANVNVHCVTNCYGGIDDVDLTLDVYRNPGPGYGSNYDITFIPQNWAPVASGLYEVSITSVWDTAAYGYTSIKYNVGVPDCQ